MICSNDATLQEYIMDIFVVIYNLLIRANGSAAIPAHLGTQM